MTYEIRMMCRKGSRSCAEIVKGAGIKRYLGKADVLINYGLTGQKFKNFYRQFSFAKSIPTINKLVGRSKYEVIQLADRNGILAPESRLELGKLTKLNNWIEKRFNSQAGYGIRKARGKSRLPNKYYQRFVNNRISELRVHGFRWITSENWNVQRRCGKEEEIAWNFNRGGHFSSIRIPMNYKDCREAIKITGIILHLLNMAFGACDFIIDTDKNVWFIEINSCPGFTEPSREIYIDAFTDLKNKNLKEILRYTSQ